MSSSKPRDLPRPVFTVSEPSEEVCEPAKNKHAASVWFLSEPGEREYPCKCGTQTVKVITYGESA